MQDWTTDFSHFDEEYAAHARRWLRRHGGTLVLSLPTHAAARNGVAVGEGVIVSLLRDGIHLMDRRAAA